LKLWAVVSQYEALVEDQETGAMAWLPEPGTDRYVHPGRYRTKPAAHRRLCRVLALGGFTGFDEPVRRSAILRERTRGLEDHKIRVAENPEGKREGYASYGGMPYGQRVRYFLALVESRGAYDVPGVYVPCAYCNGEAYVIRTWKKETEPRRCSYCGGRGTLLDRGTHGHTEPLAGTLAEA
jgi:hypothetical protein